MAAHTEQIKSDAKTIRELLDKAKYKIDFFQREYKWQFKQIELLIEGIPERNEERCFYSFFDRLGNCYKNQSLRSLFKPYKDIRNGLVHAYLDKDVTIRLSRGSCGIVLNSSQKQVKYTFHIRTYLMILELQSMVILENCQPVLKQFKK